MYAGISPFCRGGLKGGFKLLLPLSELIPNKFVVLKNEFIFASDKIGYNEFEFSK